MSDRDNPFEDELFEESIIDSEPLYAKKGEYEKVEDDTELCDCDPEHKESQPIQRSRGVSLGTLGGEVGEGTTVIVCTKCGGRFYEEESGSDGTNGFDLTF